MKARKIFWIVAIVLAISIGIYPVTYLVFDMSKGLLSSKPPEVLTNLLYVSAFYVHITFGGIALLTGWSQFSASFRARNILFHRYLGKIYLISVALAGTSGFSISYHATGGLIASLGFSCLALSWLVASIVAYTFIIAKEIEKHRKWMIRSYALTFAAVTLRLWIPIFQLLLHFDFIPAYRIIAWLCWVPNLLFAEWLVRIPVKDPIKN